MQAFNCVLIRGLVINGTAKVDIFVSVKLIKKARIITIHSKLRKNETERVLFP